jgi:hypothetical protein
MAQDILEKTDAFDDLKSWIIEYIKHKDIFLKSIVAINHTEDKNKNIIIEYKSRKMEVLIMPTVSTVKDFIDDIKKSSDKFDSVSLVVLNTKENLNKVIESWEKLSVLEKLSIYFVNPYSNNEKRWIISPYTHNRITDKSSLKTGLMSLFSTIEEIKNAYRQD